jgi:hypothetical protein
MIVCFGDIGGIDDQHCLNFHILIILKTSEIMCLPIVYFPKLEDIFLRALRHYKHIVSKGVIFSIFLCDGRYKKI